MNFQGNESAAPRVSSRLPSHFSHPQSMARQKTSLRQRLAIAIVLILLFLSPWDNLLITLQEGAPISISSGLILSTLLIALSIPEILSSFMHSTLARVVLGFTVALVPGAFLSVAWAFVEVGEMAGVLARWFGYSLVALALAGWQVKTRGFAGSIFKSLVASSLLITALSFIDYYTGVDIPYINDIGYSSALTTSRGVETAMLAGFDTRTQAAIVFEGIAAFLLGYGVIAGARRRRFLAFTTFAVIVIFMLHTGNRSFLFSIAAVFAALLYFSRGLTRFRRLLYIIIALLLIVVAGYVVFPGQAAFYQARLQSMFVEQDIAETDLLRVLLLDKAITSILEGNIFGNGPQGIPVVGSSVVSRDPHSIIAFLLWTAGIPGGIWFVTFVFLVARTILTKSYEAARPLLPYFLPILASFVGGIAHSSLGNLNLWIFMGLFIGTALLSGGPSVRHNLRTRLS